MTGEELERAIAFIIEQQAQFAANQHHHKELLLKHEETMHDHEEFMRDHEAVMRDHEKRMRDHEESIRTHDETIRRIEGVQAQTALQIQHLGRAMIELTEAHTRTDERLNALINTVERNISEGRGGKA